LFIQKKKISLKELPGMALYWECPVCKSRVSEKRKKCPKCNSLKNKEVVWWVDIWDGYTQTRIRKRIGKDKAAAIAYRAGFKMGRHRLQKQDNYCESTKKQEQRGFNYPNERKIMQHTTKTKKQKTKRNRQDF
jgi:hypothetical protein